VIAADYPSDEQIAKIIMTADKGEVDMAKMAKEKAQSKDVKKFAAHMIKDHSKSNKKTVLLSKKLKIKPVENELSTEKKAESDAGMAKLEKISGSEFDKEYMMTQIAMHEKTLNELDGTILPAVKNKKLKKMLEKTRSTVAKHLYDAQRIQLRLK
jgi:putative membrane protein